MSLNAQKTREFSPNVLRRIKLRTRLFVTFLIISLVPVITIGIFSYHAYTQSMNEKVKQAALQSIELLNNNMSTQLGIYSDYIGSISVSDTVQNGVASVNNGHPLTVDIVSGIGEMIVTIPFQSTHLKNIRVVSNDRTVIYDLGYDDITPQRFNELLDNIEAASPQDSLQYIHTYRANDKIVIGRKIYDMHHTSTPLGYIMLYIDESQLSRYIFTDVSFGEGANFLLIDAAGNVVSSQNAELLGEDLADDPIFQQITAHRQAGESNFLCELNGVDTLTIFKYNTTYNVYLAATIPQAYITNGTRTINMMLIALAAVLVVVSLFLTLLVYRSVMHPIDNMVAACNAKSDEEIGLKINDTSPDELGFLARTIDNMVNEIGLLAQRWSDDQRKMRELELQTLQYQINPHFLFNTLNTLKWIATLNHVTPVSHGIDALSSLLQSTLIKKDELIPFDDELRNLKNYCDIQQLRYAGRFEMEYQIEDAAGYWTVPRFILQPLVENSILHGTADEDDFVTITVRATVSENLLTIHISDTGCGFDPRAIKEKNSERFSGIGLSNVDERMRLHYGNEYGLTIESAPGIGTQCILCIPDDEPLIKVAFQSAVEWGKNGFLLAATASNGQEALHIVETQHIDAVITDLKMPGMDGLALIHELKKRSFTGPILVLSNYSDFDSVRTALTDGAYDYFLKINMNGESIGEHLEKMADLLRVQQQRQTEEDHRSFAIEAQKKENGLIHCAQWITSTAGSSPASNPFSMLPEPLVFPVRLFTITLIPAKTHHPAVQ